MGNNWVTIFIANWVIYIYRLIVNLFIAMGMGNNWGPIGIRRICGQ